MTLRLNGPPCSRRWQRSFVRLAVSAMVAAVMPLAIGARAALAERPAKPNVILIVADDLGYGDLSCFGAKDLRSPHLDALAASGVRLTNFYANCPVCSPTRASLLTGRYPELVGVPGVIRTHDANSWGQLVSPAHLLPEMLGKAGYHSAIVGKWHLGLAAGDRPNDRGFDFFHGFLGDMMDDYFHHRRHHVNYMRRDSLTIQPAGHATDLFTNWACDYLRSRADEAAAQRPFFLYLAYNAPHTPIQPPEEWLKRVRRRNPQLAPARAKLVALIEHMDAGIGRVLETLRETGQQSNTLVLFTSDNGGQLSVGANNGPHRDGKQSMYEGGLKVPACASWPGRIQPNTVRDEPAITMDFYPTVCEWAGVDVAHEIDGRSIVSMLTGGPPPPERDLFFHRREGGPRYEGLTISAVRRGDWKLLRNSPFAPLELYHLAVDPHEQDDQARKNPQKYRELATRLRAQTQRGGAVPWQPRR